MRRARGENMQLRTAILIWFVFAQSFTRFHKNGDIRKPKAWSSTMKELFVCIEYLKRLSTLKFDYFFYTPRSALILHVCVRNINLHKLFWSFASKFLAILLCIFLKIPLNESLLFSYHICCFWAKSNKSWRSYSELQRIVRRSVNVPFWIYIILKR